MKPFFLLFLCLFITLACSQESDLKDQKAYQDSLINEYLVNGAKKHPLYSQDYQKAMDKAIAADPNIAYFYQQKAMPLIKTGKYDLAKPLLDKAVALDEENFLDYRAFIKCIFFREYENALKDFELCKTSFGNGYVMDHSYDFYIALCKLMLNESAKAEKILQNQLDSDIREHGEDWIHYSTFFYLGIAQFEQKKFQLAIENFDKAIQLYPEFSDAYFYKSRSLTYINQPTMANDVLQIARKYGQLGYSINESNSNYVDYPYQIRW